MSDSTQDTVATKEVEKLKGKANFEVWKFQVTILMDEKGVTNVVNGTTAKPTTDDSQIKLWVKKDALGKRIIFTTLDKNLMCNIMSCQTANQMFTTLKTLYGRNQQEQKTELMRELFSTTYERGVSMTQHISKIQNIYCQLKAIDNTVSDQLLMSKILTSLPEKMSHFVTSWDVTPTSEKTVDNLVSKLLMEEQRQKKDVEKGVAFEANSNSKKCFRCHRPGHVKRNCRAVLTCEICKKTGHLTQYCRTREGDVKTCNFCSKKGHTEDKCYAKNKGSGSKGQTKGNDNRVAFSVHNEKDDSAEWIVDSGASNHITNNSELLSSISDVSETIGVAKKGNAIEMTKRGKFHAKECTLLDVFYSSEVRRNLLSVGAITDFGGTVMFTKNEVLIKKDEVVLKGTKTENGTFSVKLHPTWENEAHLADSSVDAWTWHRRLGHLSASNMCKLLNVSDGIKIQSKDINNAIKNCQICIQAKQARLPFNTERQKATRVLEIIHSDVCYVDPLTWDEKRYFVTFMDGYSGFVYVYLLNSKSEVSECFKEYVAEVEAKWGLKVSKLRSDNGGEYKSNSFKSWCKERGIVPDFSTPYSPQQNGASERLNRTILDKARALVFESTLGKEMWGEAVLTAVHIINRSPKSGRELTPYEVWFQKKPDLTRLKIFGSQAYAQILPKPGKFDERSQKLTFVGYGPNGYRLWDTNSREIVLRRDVKFIERKVKFTECDVIEKDVATSGNSSVDADIILSDTLDESTPDESTGERNAEGEERDTTTTQESDSELVDAETDDDSEWLPSGDENGNVTVVQDGERRYPDRERFPVSRYTDNAFLADRVLPYRSAPDPKTYQEAVTSPESDDWKIAINAEVRALESNKTWVLVDKSQARGAKILTSRWVFRTKEDGVKKARLVVRGFEQGDVDYGELFSPVANASSVRTLLAIAVEKDMHLAKFDVKSAFLNGKLDQDVFMHIPTGFKRVEGKLCKLEKALYGLKQAPQAWNTTLTQRLIKNNLKQLKTDSCIFRNKEKTIYMSVHVDDGLTVWKYKGEVERLFGKLREEFEMKIEFEPKEYIGIEIETCKNAIKISQKRYIESVLMTFNMQDAKAVETPMVPENLSNNEQAVNGTKQLDIVSFPYRKAVGSLLYLSNKTRPDLAFATNVASRCLDNPEKKDIIRVKRILRYLKGTPSDGIIFSKSGTCNVTGYSDSDYAGDLMTRRSTTGLIVFLGTSPVSWTTRRQTTVATSSTEAELVAATDCVKELAHMRNLITELFDSNTKNEMFVKEGTLSLLLDNQGAIKLIQNGVNSKRTKHLDVKYHYIKERVERNLINIKFIGTDEQTADILTKPLQRVKFAYHKTKLMGGCSS